jgi:hypothetical protein
VVTLLATLRQATPVDAADAVVEALNRGVAVASVWDAMFLSGAELMFNNPTGIEALHAVTASNAAHSAFLAARDDATRRLLVLQNAARVADFHRYTAAWAIRRNRSPTHALAIEELEPSAVAADPQQALDDIFADVGLAPSRMRAAQKTLGYLAADPARADRLTARAAENAITRATDTHDVKIWAAAYQDHARISPAWRAPYLAACTARFRGDAEPRNALADRLDDVAATIG